MNSIDEIWAADLIDIQAFSKNNYGIKYLLTVIDIFSKFNKDVQKIVELYSTENEEKSCVIERFNRTIKEKNV